VKLCERCARLEDDVLARLESALAVAGKKNWQVLQSGRLINNNRSDPRTCLHSQSILLLVNEDEERCLLSELVRPTKTALCGTNQEISPMVLFVAPLKLCERCARLEDDVLARLESALAVAGKKNWQVLAAVAVTVFHARAV
jgi:hypothetical protein